MSTASPAAFSGGTCFLCHTFVPVGLQVEWIPPPSYLSLWAILCPSQLWISCWQVMSSTCCHCCCRWMNPQVTPVSLSLLHDLVISASNDPSNSLALSVPSSSPKGLPFILPQTLTPWLDLRPSHCTKLHHNLSFKQLLSSHFFLFSFSCSTYSPSTSLGPTKHWFTHKLLSLIPHFLPPLLIAVNSMAPSYQHIIPYTTRLLVWSYPFARIPVLVKSNSLPRPCTWT